MMEKYDCITFHTSACDEHQDRVLNVRGPEGLDYDCPLCTIEHMQEVIDRVARIRLDLESENRRLRAALERIAEVEFAVAAKQIARKALQEGES